MTTTITREQGGWTATCDRCPWLYHARVLAEVHRRRRWHVCEEVASAHVPNVSARACVEVDINGREVSK